MNSLERKEFNMVEERMVVHTLSEFAVRSQGPSVASLAEEKFGWFCIGVLAVASAADTVAVETEKVVVVEEEPWNKDRPEARRR
jgi:hypothetical protein